MLTVVSVSLGSSSRDKTSRATFLGEEIELRRVGTDGDLQKAHAMIAELDGKVDAIGLGGIDLYLPHQVSRKQIQMFADFMGLDMTRIYLILERFGNMASAALPSALSMASRDGSLQTGDRAALVGVGSGLNCSIMKVIW